MKDFLREVDGMAEEPRKLDRLEKATDEELHDFLIHIDEPEFQKLKRFQPRVEALLDAIKHRQAKEAKRTDHRIGGRTLHWTVWVGLLTAAGILVAVLLSLLFH